MDLGFCVGCIAVVMVWIDAGRSGRQKPPFCFGRWSVEVDFTKTEPKGCTWHALIKQMIITDYSCYRNYYYKFALANLNNYEHMQSMWTTFILSPSFLLFCSLLFASLA